MHLKRVLLSVGPALAITLPLAGCATVTPERVAITVTDCGSDPDTKSFLCVDQSGDEYSLLWTEAKGKKSMVCRPPADDAILKEAANAK